MTDLLSHLGDLDIHRLLAEGHSLKHGGRLVDRLNETFIGLGLSHYKVLHQTLEVGFRLRRWVVDSSMLVPRRLYKTLRIRVRVPIERVWVTLLTLTVSSGVGSIMWWRVTALKGVSMVNGERAIVALNRCIPLQTISLTSSVNSNCARSTHLGQSLYQCIHPAG